MTAVRSFAPVARADAHTLILGSMPGVASLQAQQYYAHPRNAFWRIMAGIAGFDAHAAYALRLEALQRGGFALWDVLGSCIRPGSLDTSIDTGSIVTNDIAGLLRRHRRIRRIAFNGGTAATLFRRHVQPQLGEIATGLQFVQLPSTSPAHAALDAVTKGVRWRALLVDRPVPERLANRASRSRN